MSKDTELERIVLTIEDIELVYVPATDVGTLRDTKSKCEIYLSEQRLSDLEILLTQLQVELGHDQPSDWEIESWYDGEDNGWS